MRSDRDFKIGEQAKWGAVGAAWEQMSEVLPKVTKDFPKLTEVSLKVTEDFVKLTELIFQMTEPPVKIDRTIQIVDRTASKIAVHLSKHALNLSERFQTKKP